MIRLGDVGMPRWGIMVHSITIYFEARDIVDATLTAEELISALSPNESGTLYRYFAPEEVLSHRYLFNDKEIALCEEGESVMRYVKEMSG